MSQQPKRYACAFCEAVIVTSETGKFTVTHTVAGARRGQWAFCCQEHAWRYMARIDLTPQLMGGSLPPLPPEY